MKKIFSLVIALLSVQANVIMPMASLHTLKDSVLKDKGLAFIAAGAGVALATSLAAATYCYRNKNAYARQKTDKQTLMGKVENTKKLVQENTLLLKLCSIAPCTKGSLHPAAAPGKSYATLVREPSENDDCKKILDAWKKRLEGVKAPDHIQSEFDILREEIFEGGVPNEKEFIKARNRLIKDKWFVSFKNRFRNDQNDLQAFEKELAEEKARSWTKLLRGMGFGYLASASLMLYGFYYGKKA